MSTDQPLTMGVAVAAHQEFAPDCPERSLLLLSNPPGVVCPRCRWELTWEPDA